MRKNYQKYKSVAYNDSLTITNRFLEILWVDYRFKVLQYNDIGNESSLVCIFNVKPKQQLM